MLFPKFGMIHKYYFFLLDNKKALFQGLFSYFIPITLNIPLINKDTTVTIIIKITIKSLINRHFTSIIGIYCKLRTYIFSVSIYFLYFI